MIHYILFLISVLIIGVLKVLYPDLDLIWHELLTLSLVEFALARGVKESILIGLLLSLFGVVFFSYDWGYYLATLLFYLGIVLLVSEWKKKWEIRQWITEGKEDISTMFYAMDLLEREIRGVREYGGQLTIAILDLDNFHEINKRLGYIQGDLLLRAFGKILVRHLRPSDVATRYAGDEFLVIFPNTVGERAQEILDEIRIKMRESNEIFHLGNLSNPFSFCAGIVEYSPEYETVRDFFRAAEEGLYSAKQKGKDVSIIIKKDRTLSFRNRRYWERIKIGDPPLQVVIYDTKGVPHKGEVGNICLGGMMFFSPVKIERGKICTLEIEFFDGDKIVVDAKGVWYREIDNGVYQIGVFLSHLSPQQKFVLKRKLEKIKSRNAQEY